MLRKNFKSQCHSYSFRIAPQDHSKMRNPHRYWTLLIPWASILTLTFVSGFENPFRPRGASLFNARTSTPLNLDTRRSHYYYYDPVAPVSVRQRRQRQFGAEQLIAPVVVLNTGRAEPARVQIKELPPLKTRSRQLPPSPSGFFVNPTISTIPPTPAPTPTTSSASFARFNQFGSTLFTIAQGSPGNSNSQAGVSRETAARNPVKLPENRFTPTIIRDSGFVQPVTQTSVKLPQPEPIVGRVRATSIIPTLASPSNSRNPAETTRTLFSGFTSRSTTPATSSLTSSSVGTSQSSSTKPPAEQQPTLASFTTTLSQRTLTTTRFLRPRVPLTSAPSSSTFER